MLPLAEVQQRLRDAVVHGDASRAAGLFAAGGDPERRLAIHQRHYRSSLASALLTKFQATEWLVGSLYLRERADEFVQFHPPNAPCIAEYGEAFPQFLSAGSNAERVPYLQAFAELEWQIGQAAISVDQPGIGLDTLSQLNPTALPRAIVDLQPGLRYLAAAWPVDELMKLYLSASRPDRYSIAPADVWLEVHGSRGEFELDRLEPAEFCFRRKLRERQTIADAAEDALDIDSTFDPGRALVRLVHAGRVIGVTMPNLEHRS